MYPGKLFLYLKFQPWILWSFWISYCWKNLRIMKFHDLKQIIHESRIPRAINQHMHSGGIHESRFFLSNFHASRTNFSAHHASRINPLPPSHSTLFFDTDELKMALRAPTSYVHNLFKESTSEIGRPCCLNARQLVKKNSFIARGELESVPLIVSWTFSIQQQLA